jgi:hypothetical protein
MSVHLILALTGAILAVCLAIDIWRTSAHAARRRQERRRREQRLSEDLRLLADNELG